MCFAPAQDPQVLCLVIINNPTGVYYGGTIAAPVAKEIFLNILPYLGIEKDPAVVAKEQAEKQKAAKEQQTESGPAED